MEKLVETFIQQHGLLHNGAKVLIGVSGGPDSMALLSFLRSVQSKWDLQLRILSVEHGLRSEESVADYQFVEKLATDWNLPFSGITVDAHEYAKVNKVSTEVAARELRYGFFKEQMLHHEADYLALGHHGDDQIETLLMKLTRSASSTAYTGIPIERPFANGRIIRPLLAVSRADIEAYCAENQLNPRIDATNFEIEHTRNYFRQLVVPLLKKRNSQLHRTAQQLSKTLTEDESYLQKQAKLALEETTTLFQLEQKVDLNIKPFLALDIALQRRIYKLILNYLYEGKLPNHLSYIHEEQFFLLIKEQSGHAQIDFPDDLKLSRSYDTLTFHFETKNRTMVPLEQEIPIPGKTTLANGAVLETSISLHRLEDDRFTCYLNKNEVTFPLYVRNRKPGDRMSWDGLSGTKKIKDIFIDLKVPKMKRDTWPILVDAKGKILWLVGLKKAAMSPQTDQPLVCIRYKKDNFIGGK